MIYFIEAVMELPTDGLDVEVDPDYVQKQLLHFNLLKSTLENGESFQQPLVNQASSDPKQRMPIKPKL